MRNIPAAERPKAPRARAWDALGRADGVKPSVAPGRLAVMLLLAGCQSPSADMLQPNSGGAANVSRTPGKLPPVIPMGQVIPVAGANFKVRRVRRCKPDRVYQPAEGLEQLGVHVQLEGADKVTRVDPFERTVLIDGRGKRRRPVLGGCEPMLKAVTLEESQKASGWLTFEVPKGASGFALEVRTSIGPKGKWVRIELSR